jgi:hypothetical protein
LLTPCVEFNKTVTYKTLDLNVRELPDSYVPDSKLKAIEFSDHQDPVYLGRLFEETIPTFDDHMQKTIQLATKKSW